MFEEDVSVFIDDSTEIESNSSDYYGLVNVTRTHSSTKKDVHSRSDIDAFLSDNVEARNYLPPNYNVEEEKVDGFSNSENKVQKFIDTLLIPH